MFWLACLCLTLFLTVLALCIKIVVMRRSALEIREELLEWLKNDTNTLITISSKDRMLKLLANDLNIQLRELRKHRHRFIQGDAELKTAITNISHDLRTPLTAICGYLDLLEKEEKTSEVERYFEIIKSRTEILTQLTEELFRYSVIISTEKNTIKEPVIINGVLEESIAAFYTTLNQSGIVPNIQITEKKIIRNLDHSALTRVFSNLLNNAVKYSDGDLNITLSNTGEIIFENTASGLNEIQVGKLFDRFYTVEAAKKSTGLGLAIARTLVEQMNGTISAQYENGKLTICILLPDTSKE